VTFTSLRCATLLLAAVFSGELHCRSQFAVAELRLVPQHRRPGAAALSNDGAVLYVANQRSGTFSVIDTTSLAVIEQSLGQQLSDIVTVPKVAAAQFLVTDFGGHQLIVLEAATSDSSSAAEFLQPGGKAVGLTSVGPSQRIDVAQYPVSVSVSDDGLRACVASLWSRRVTLLERSIDTSHGQWRKTSEIDLQFAPRETVFVDHEHVVVVDSFGGRLVVVNSGSKRIVAEHVLPIHNVRDLVAADGSLFLTHQRLNPLVPADHDNIHWGVLMQNEVAAIPVAGLMNASLNIERQWSLGEPGDGAGDPESIVVTDDRLFVSYGGTNELALIDRVGIREVRIPVGVRPVEMSYDSRTSRAFVVNELADSVSVVDVSTGETTATVSLGPTPEAGPVERGEQAFFNARLSLENWMSCQSCHTDGHTNNGLADTLGDGGYGESKRVPTLRGVWSTGPWAWNGSQFQLHSQIAKSVRSTMRNDERPDRKQDAAHEQLISDLVAYVTTLERAPSVLTARGQSAHPSIGYQRRQLFEDVGCAECHNGFTSYTSDGSYDVGLRDSVGNSKFNPPSLIGVSQRDRLFHDGRATTLDAVLNDFRHPLGLKLTSEQRRLLTTFLRGL